mmetsp:Transcript_751/g.2916  ORF Transcript_751/g.2916 Transcript_751/m.2916 type:complete len:220 (-) Transcript_751:386-1045(-)
MGVINPPSVATATATSTSGSVTAAARASSHLAFTLGDARRALAAAYKTQSFTEARTSLALSAARSRATDANETSAVTNSCGVFVLDSSSLDAMTLRIEVTGRSSQFSESSSGVGGWRDAVGDVEGFAFVVEGFSAAAADGEGTGAAHSPMAARTSPLTSIPRGPVGVIVLGSMPDSARSLRTDGHIRPPVSTDGEADEDDAFPGAGAGVEPAAAAAGAT